MPYYPCLQCDLVCCGVLSGNRNFEGRIHPNTRANYLASPLFVIGQQLTSWQTCLSDPDPTLGFQVLKSLLCKVQKVRYGTGTTVFRFVQRVVPVLAPSCSVLYKGSYRYWYHRVPFCAKGRTGTGTTVFRFVQRVVPVPVLAPLCSVLSKGSFLVNAYGNFFVRFLLQFLALKKFVILRQYSICCS